ncbi:hypothetical protein ABEF86_16555 (plasmid) [Acinetobacter thermotolerans]|uniref:hypothetical protein n=1 Tax=Acinetobacter thermotolerans TaxID=3151487 RepID=UPI00325AE391
MNLIEQLGGYEKAKKKLKMFYLLRTETMVDTVGNIFDRSQLEAALLQYRRQHNIFEVGDKVKAKDHQFGFDELFRIDDFFANDDGVNLAVLDDGDCYPISFLEHATDAEIKAGKRLEVNQ